MQGNLLKLLYLLVFDIYHSWLYIDSQLVDLIANRQQSEAQALMLEHLNDIEAELVFERPVKETDLEAVFQAIRKPL
jgi:DNA-binding GntR family transcriptional regulator